MERGLKRAGAALIRESLHEVPIDTGALRASWYVRQEKELARTEILVGYTVAYALMVHEDLTLTHGAAYNIKYATDIAAGIKHKRRPQEKAKFLIDPFNANRDRLIKIVRDSLKTHHDTIL
jgi:hypothetical protein